MDFDNSFQKAVDPCISKYMKWFFSHWFPFAYQLSTNTEVEFISVLNKINKFKIKYLSTDVFGFVTRWQGLHAFMFLCVLCAHLLQIVKLVQVYPFVI